MEGTKNPERRVDSVRRCSLLSANCEKPRYSSAWGLSPCKAARKKRHDREDRRRRIHSKDCRSSFRGYPRRRSTELAHAACHMAHEDSIILIFTCGSQLCTLNFDTEGPKEVAEVHRAVVSETWCLLADAEGIFDSSS